MNAENLEYVGFWSRVGAVIADACLVLLLTTPFSYLILHSGLPVDGFHSMALNVTLTFVLPALAIMGLWVRIGATPGKWLISSRVVDADTGEPLTNGKALIRFLGYFVSLTFLLIGFFWVVCDRRKQSWHDKMANSVVVRPKKIAPVHFSAQVAPDHKLASTEQT